MNAGTIQDTDTLKVRMQRRRGGAPLGEVEEAFAATLTPGDTFLIGGQVVRFEGLRELVVEVSKRANKEPKIAVFGGTKFATSTQLSERILHKFETVIFAACQITRPTGWNCKKPCPCCHNVSHC